MTSVAVLIVAAIAATVSFLHISHLALEYGQVPLAAYLMPISVDGVVTVSSLAMFRSARAGSSSPIWARSGLVLGVLATLAANVTSGIAFGPIGAVVAGWPAIGFVVSAETAISLVRRKPARVPATSAPVTVPATTSAAIRDVAADMPTASASEISDEIRERYGVKVTPGSVRAVRSRDATRGVPVTTPEIDGTANPANPGGRLGRMLEQETMALTALSVEPDMGYPELASALGVSESTARRVKARLNGRTPKVTA